MTAKSEHEGLLARLDTMAKNCRSMNLHKDAEREELAAAAIRSLQAQLETSRQATLWEIGLHKDTKAQQGEQEAAEQRHEEHRIARIREENRQLEEAQYYADMEIRETEEMEAAYAEQEAASAKEGDHG